MIGFGGPTNCNLNHGGVISVRLRGSAKNANTRTMEHGTNSRDTRVFVPTAQYALAPKTDLLPL
jgi:hypothetical protein